LISIHDLDWEMLIEIWEYIFCECVGLLGLKNHCYCDICRLKYVFIINLTQLQVILLLKVVLNNKLICNKGVRTFPFPFYGSKFELDLKTLFTRWQTLV